jgi:hypothetical protein
LALFPVYVALMDWGNQWTCLPAPPMDLLHKPCGQRVGARVVCSECGQDLDARDTKLPDWPAPAAGDPYRRSKMGVSRCVTAQ